MRVLLLIMVLIAGCKYAPVADAQRLSILDLPMWEGTKDAVRVVLDRSTTRRVSVSWAARNGTAGGKDFWTNSTGSGTLRFNPGETVKTIPVTALEDGLKEGDEAFTIRLSRAYGASISIGTATVTIKDAGEPEPPPPPPPPPNPDPEPEPEPPPPPNPTRDYRAFPFAENTWWNLPVNKPRAVYSAPLSQRYSQMSKGWINCGQHSVNVLYGGAADPIRTVTETGNERPGSKYQVPLPNNATGSAGSGSDQHLVVIDAGGRYAHEFYLFPQSQIGNATSVTVGTYNRVDLQGNGWPGIWVRATGTSVCGGLIRKADLDQKAIRHKLAIAIPDSVLSEQIVPPADRKDGGGNGDQVGTVPYGSVLAIPQNVNIATLGLSEGGLILGRALQDYGCFVVDRSGPVNQSYPPPMYAEQSLNGHTLINQMNGDVSKLVSRLAVVTQGGY